MATDMVSRKSPVTPEALVNRAREMIPRLTERGPAADRTGRVPDETVAEMKQAGFFRVMQPQRFGGYEMNPRFFYEIQMALAEGCMSTAWIYGVLGVHPWQLALFDVR